MSIRLNHAGIAKVLRSAPVHAMVDDLAAELASTVRANPNIVRHSAEVIAESYETDRAAAAVLIKHPAGLGIEGKHGVLTSAAAEAGITISEPKHARS